MIAITTSTDHGYLPAACCQLASVADHLGDRGDVALFLVCCDVDGADLAEADRFFSARQMDVRVLVPRDVADRIQVVDARWPRAAYLRLHFDELFSREFDRLVYFDADTRVLTDLDPLLGADLDGNPVGAVHDFIYYVTGNIRRRRRDLFLAADSPYLQSGVMVFDWPSSIDAGILQAARDFLGSYPDRCVEAPDQDALNVALERRWTPLDPRWNLHELYLTFGGRQLPFVEHYTSTKPWSRKRPPAWRDAAAWYQRELQGTGWERFVEPQRRIDALLSRLRFLRFRYGSKVRRGLIGRAPHVLARAGTRRSPDDEEVLPWAPPNRQIVEVMTEALIQEAEHRRSRLVPPESALWGRCPVP